jgi:hypothetical protein
MAIHQAGHEDAPGQVANLATVGRQVRAHFRYRAIIGYPHIGDSVERHLRVDKPRAFKQ